MHATADIRDPDEWLGYESMLSVPGWAPADPAPTPPERAPATRMSLERGRPQPRSDEEGASPA